MQLKLPGPVTGRAEGGPPARSRQELNPPSVRLCYLCLCHEVKIWYCFTFLQISLMDSYICASAFSLF